MSDNKYHIPPPSAKRFLHWFCKPELVEDISGDLEEDFNDFVDDYGLRKARVKYWMAVIKFLKPFAIRRMSITITQSIMFKNYFKTSVRSIARNKLFSAINIIGLAISMSVCLLMISFISEIFGYDKFHPDADRLYRVISNETYLGRDLGGVAAAPLLGAKRLAEEVPGIESMATMNRRFGGDATFENNTVSLRGLWASKDFFKLFSAFPLLQGNPATALAEPNSIVLTEEAASKVFGDEDPMGQVFELSDTQFTVTGIVRKPPFNSHFTFESLGSMITYENAQRQAKPDNSWLKWTSMGNDYIYIRLAENTSPDEINLRLAQIAKEENAKNERFRIDVKLQPLLSIMPGPQLSNNIGKSLDIKTLRTLIILTFVVILSAGFNYTNLSIARSLRRAKEVGVRKVVGATRKQVFSQFIIEAVIVSLIALICASLLFYLIKPAFLNIDNSIQQSVRMTNTPSLFIYFLLFSILIGIMAGFFPALFLSKIQAVNALKKVSARRLFGQMSMRKALIVIQFALSIIFIISATISYRQYKYALAFDLGFQTENVVNIRLQGNDPAKVVEAFAAIPEVTQISKAMVIHGIGERDGTRITTEGALDSASLSFNIIDENYIPLMQHELLAGSNFDNRPQQEKEESIIVNESTLKRFNLGSPQEAIDKHIQLVRGSRLRIRGVIKDFVYSDITSPIGLFGFRYAPGNYSYINLKVNSADLMGTIAKLESAWKAVDPADGFRFQFYDQQIEATYAQYDSISTAVGFLAFITISIAVLGLFGMAVYTAETRLKEISLRKIMGATHGTLIKLLTRGFLWLLIISTVIAVPITYYIFDSMVLSNSAHRISIGIVELFSGVVAIFAIGLLTIGSQTLKAARANPAETLRSE